MRPSDVVWMNHPNLVGRRRQGQILWGATEKILPSEGGRQATLFSVNTDGRRFSSVVVDCVGLAFFVFAVTRRTC